MVFKNFCLHHCMNVGLILLHRYLSVVSRRLQSRRRVFNILPAAAAAAAAVSEAAGAQSDDDDDDDDDGQCSAL